MEYVGESRVRESKDITLGDYTEKTEKNLVYCNAVLGYDKSRLLFHFSQSKNWNRTLYWRLSFHKCRDIVWMGWSRQKMTCMAYIGVFVTIQWETQWRMFLTWLPQSRKKPVDTQLVLETSTKLLQCKGGTQTEQQKGLGCKARRTRITWNWIT